MKILRLATHTKKTLPVASLFQADMHDLLEVVLVDRTERCVNILVSDHIKIVTKKCKIQNAANLYDRSINGLLNASLKTVVSLHAQLYFCADSS